MSTEDRLAWESAKDLGLIALLADPKNGRGEPGSESQPEVECDFAHSDEQRVARPEARPWAWFVRL
jgi:hypothetical protein